MFFDDDRLGFLNGNFDVLDDFDWVWVGDLDRYLIGLGYRYFDLLRHLDGHRMGDGNG